MRKRSPRKLSKSVEWIIEEYTIKGRSRKELAKECGLSEAGFKSVLLRYGIKAKKDNINKETLIELINQGLNREEICNILGVTKSSLEHKLYRLKLKVTPIRYSSYDSAHDEEIIALYKSGQSSTQIAKFLGWSHHTVLNHLKYNNINRRTLSDSQYTYNGKEKPKDFLNYDKMYDLYINQQLSKKEIALIYNTDGGTIDRILKSFNIPIRGCSEAQKGKRVGSMHHNWKGGRTTVYARLREYFYINQVPTILKRDNYKCQLCGKSHPLQVHHIKPFKDIFDRILKEHPELDVIKDSEEIYKIATKDTELNDLDNLITYCQPCHLYKIHKYKNHNSIGLRHLEETPSKELRELLETPEMDNQQPSLSSNTFEGSTTIPKGSTLK